jgi:sulfide:quinone oxidoreductase
MKKLLILGSGAGGTIIANSMKRKLNMKEWEITIVDKSLDHIYQPGLLFLPFGLYGYEGPEAVRKTKKDQLPSGVKFVQGEVKNIDHNGRKVETSNGSYDYDYLVIALGCDIHPEDVDGMEAAMGKNCFTFYNLQGAMDMQKAMAKFDKGRLVLNIAEIPFKCPVAPIEFVYLADYYFQKRGIRDKVEIILSTPLAGAFTKPIATAVFSKAMEKKNIKVIPNFNVGTVDHANKVMKSHDGQEIEYDLLAAIPPNQGAEVVDDSGLGTGAGFVVVDQETLKSKKADRIYAVGDVTNVPTSKAGSVAHFMAEIVVENLLAEINGKEANHTFDGHSNCFIESGFKKAYLIDFNYKIEPLPGKFPLPVVGPFTLLGDTKINHMGKMAFRGMYWDKILKGKPIGAPFVKANMSMTGKDASLLKDH